MNKTKNFIFLLLIILANNLQSEDKENKKLLANGILSASYFVAGVLSIHHSMTHLELNNNNNNLENNIIGFNGILLFLAAYKSTKNLIDEFNIKKIKNAKLAEINFVNIYRKNIIEYANKKLKEGLKNNRD